MKALVYKREGVLAFEDAAVPAPGEGEVLVKVAACGVCGTDLKIVHGHYRVDPGRIPGHEFAGAVEEVGPGVQGIAPGDRVTVNPNLTCGACSFCLQSKINLCRRLTGIGVHRDGGFAEFVAVPANACHRLSEKASIEEAALSEPLSCVVHAVDVAGVDEEKAVLVIGGGIAGQMMVQVALHRGASNVMLTTRSPHKRDLALSFGVAIACHPRDAREAVLDATGGLGADVIIEAVGKTETLDLAIRCVRDGGRVVLYGLVADGERWEVEPFRLLSRGITISPAWLAPETFADAVRLIESRALSLGALLTRRAPLEEGPGVFEELGSAKGSFKVLLMP